MTTRITTLSENRATFGCLAEWGLSMLVEAGGARVLLDTGMGIAAEDRDRIFDRFYRVKNEKTRYIVGTGLGLPIVKSIVDAHHGQVQVDSKLGRGTTFSIFLPLGDSFLNI